MSISESEQVLRYGSVRKSLMVLGIPSIVAMLITAVYNFVDALFIGMLNDTAAMGAISLSMPIFVIVGAVGAIVGVGGSSYISRCLGAKKLILANRTASVSILMMIVMSIVITVGSLLFLTPILEMLGASKQMMIPAKSYTSIMLIGSIFLVAGQVFSSFVRSEGAARFSMVALILGAVVNIVLDPIFIFVLDMGVSGAAIATVIAQIVSVCYFAYFYISKQGTVQISPKYISRSIREDWPIYMEVIKIGLPLFLLQILFSISGTLLNRTVAVYGDAAIAGMGIASRIYQIPVFIFMGFIQGYQPFASYNYGAKQFQRVREALKFTIILFAVTSVCISLIIHMNPEFYVTLFTKDRDAIAVAVNQLSANMVTFPFIGIVFVYSVLFQALGKSRYATVLSLSRQGLIYIPVIYTLPKLFEAFSLELSGLTNRLPYEVPAGMYGIAFSQPVSDLCAFLLTMILAVKINKVLRQEEMNVIKAA